MNYTASLKNVTRRAVDFLMGDAQADRVVPPTGFTARLTILAAAAMAFLAVFALALSLAAGRLAERWGDALAGSATIRISAPADQMEPQVAAVLEALRTTPGVISARLLDQDEQSALLEPWFGPDLPLDVLPLPRLIEIETDPEIFDPEGLRNRLAGEAPGAVLDDHATWRTPLVRAASRLRLLGVFTVLIIGAATAMIIALATSVALAANAQVIQVLRLVGALDAYIAGAFVRRFTLRALGGAALGTALGVLAILVLPGGAGSGGSFLTGLRFQGVQWLLPFTIPPLAALVAYFAASATARVTLRRST